MVENTSTPRPDSYTTGLTMTPLNTIIEEERKAIAENIYKRIENDPLWENWLRQSITTAIQRAYEAGQSEERAKIRESFNEWNKSTEDIQDWADRVLTPDNK